MILGSGDSTPYDMLALALLCILALVMLVGASVGPSWGAEAAAMLVRRGSMAAAIVVMLALHVATPTPDGIVGAARLITLWPALAANVLFFAVWSWRVGRL